MTPETLIVILVLGHLFCGLIAFGLAKYHFTEINHYHDNLEYKEAFNLLDHLVDGVLAFLCGFLTLVIWLFCKKIDRNKILRSNPELSDHYYGIAFTKNLRWPNHHRSSS